MWSSPSWARDAGTSAGARKAAQTRRGGGAPGVPAAAPKASQSMATALKPGATRSQMRAAVTPKAAPKAPTAAPKAAAAPKLATPPTPKTPKTSAAPKPEKPKKEKAGHGKEHEAGLHSLAHGVHSATKGLETLNKYYEPDEQISEDAEDCGKPLGQWQWKPKSWAKDQKDYTPIPTCDEQIAPLLPKLTLAMDWRGCLGLSDPVSGTPTLAFDRNSVRRYDREGRLMVDSANISKATVNPYWGKEIPGYEVLRLDPEKKYYLLRDPKELARPETVASFRRQPVLMKHQPSSADDHPLDLTVGATGDDVRYEHPYLKASLAFWPRHAIDAIESNKQKELSSSYHYDPVMEPGVYTDEHGNRMRYDGRMTNIRANHVALVEEGRAGSDVVVSDGKLPEKYYKW